MPSAYILGAIFVWVDFAGSPPDGLANIWIALYTLPVMLLARLLTQREFPYVNSSLGYYEAHAVYFWVSVFVIAILLFFLGFGFQKLIQKKIVICVLLALTF